MSTLRELKGPKKRSESQTSLKNSNLRNKFRNRFNSKKNIPKAHSKFTSKGIKKERETSFRTSKKLRGANPGGSSQLMQLKSILEGYKNDIETRKRKKFINKYSPDKFRSFENKKRLGQKNANNQSLDSGRYLNSKKSNKGTFSNKGIRGTKQDKYGNNSVTARNRTTKSRNYNTSRSREQIRKINTNTRFGAFKTSKKESMKRSTIDGDSAQSVQKIKSKLGKSKVKKGSSSKSKGDKMKSIGYSNIRDISKYSPGINRGSKSKSKTGIKKKTSNRFYTGIRSSSKRNNYGASLSKTTHSSKVNTERGSRMGGKKKSVTPTRYGNKNKGGNSGKNTQESKKGRKYTPNQPTRNYGRSEKTPASSQTPMHQESKEIVQQEEPKKSSKLSQLVTSVGPGANSLLQKFAPKKNVSAQPQPPKRQAATEAPTSDSHFYNTDAEKFTLQTEQSEDMVNFESENSGITHTQNQNHPQTQRSHAQPQHYQPPGQFSQLQQPPQVQPLASQVSNPQTSSRVPPPRENGMRFNQHQLDSFVPAPMHLDMKGLHKIDDVEVATYHKHLYYMDNLRLSLQDQEDQQNTTNTESNLYKEHFYQTVQSLLFLKNIEKIDECSLIEKTVYMPPNQQNKKSLILDLDETLVHCNETLDQKYDHLICIKFANGDEVEAGINIRPYAHEFLRKMSEVFEIIVFTASHSCYANVVLNILDPENKYITFRLFRDHCLQTKEGIFIKDLRIIANRKQENIAIVDNATYSFGFQLDNGIPIVPFYDNEKDKELLHLMSFLYKMNGQQDVRLFNRQHFEYDFLNQNCHDYDFLAENLKNGSSPVNGNIG